MYIFCMKNKNLLMKFSPFLVSLFLYGCASTQQAQVVTTQKEVPAVQKEVKKTHIEKNEYEKSVGSLTVSQDTFEADKAEILRNIEELKTIMRDFDYKSWLLHVDEESRIYWSKNSNLKKAQSKLPIKGLQLRTLQDYFKYVFVPSRAGRDVTTLRYESENYVKAVQVTDSETDDSAEKYTVYYYFNKINGHWQLHLPEIEN